MKIIIDPYRGGNDLGSKINNQYEKDILLNISEYMSSQFKKYNYDTFLTRNNDIQLSDNDRNNIIKNNVSKGDLIIQNRFSDNNEFNIIYPLRNNDSLPSYIDKNLEKLGFNVNKYFQRRLPSDTSLDYYSIIRENNPYNVLIIEFNDIDNYKEIVSDIVKSIVNYYDNTKYYIVKKGDSLYSIALSYNTTVDELKKINSLNSNNLSIGQKLIIPSIVEDNDSNNIEEDYFTYIVKSGDTLYGIAKKYNISVDVLKNLNKLSSNLLSVGQKIIIPNIVEDNDIDYGENYFTYIVKSGDTLYGISKKYNISVDEIKNINNLSSNLLSVGQIIKIPNDLVNNQDSYLIYTVKKGDTLYSIANKYNTSVDKIKTINNLSNNNLTIGSNLKIPV